MLKTILDGLYNHCTVDDFQGFMRDLHAEELLTSKQTYDDSGWIRRGEPSWSSVNYFDKEKVTLSYNTNYHRVRIDLRGTLKGTAGVEKKILEKLGTIKFDIEGRRVSPEPDIV